MSAKSIVHKKAIAKKVKRLIFVRIVSDRLRVSSGQEKKGILRGEGGKCLEVTQRNEDERCYIARINEMV